MGIYKHHKEPVQELTVLLDVFLAGLTNNYFLNESGWQQCDPLIVILVLMSHFHSFFSCTDVQFHFRLKAGHRLCAQLDDEKKKRSDMDSSSASKPGLMR